MLFEPLPGVVKNRIDTAIVASVQLSLRVGQLVCGTKPVFTSLFDSKVLKTGDNFQNDWLANDVPQSSGLR